MRRSFTFTVLLIFNVMTIAKAQTLHEYIAEAMENNPELKAIESTYQEKEKAIDAAYSLPNTTVGIGYFVSEPETRTGAQKARVSAEQKLPWFGTLQAKASEAKAISEVEKNQVEVTKRKITLAIKKSYYKLYALKAKENILEQQKTILKQTREVVLAALENNKATAIDVLKINITENEIKDEIEKLKGAILNEELQFNALLNRDGFEQLVIPNNLIIPEEEPTLTIGEVEYHPELLKYDLIHEVVNQQQRVNKKESLPSIGVGLDYVVVEERPNQVFNDNGKDIWMPKISMSIPIFNKKYNTKNKTLAIAQERVDYERTSTQNKLRQILEKAINDRITTRINYDTQQKNIQQIEEAEKIAIGAYQAEKIAFEEILELQQMRLKFEKKKVEIIQNYFIQTAIINYLN
ncbi:TolC family protein [Aquimarina rhabdastrellae]